MQSWLQCRCGRWALLPFLALQSWWPAAACCMAQPFCCQLTLFPGRMPLQAQSAAALAEREREYAAMLQELRALRLAMSRAPTRQEERPDSSGQQGARHVALQQAAQQPQGQNVGRTLTALGQLMEPHSDEEDGRWWEQPRAVPPLPLAQQHA